MTTNPLNSSNPLEHFTLLELRARTSEKWQNYADDVIPMWVAEMDVAPPEALVTKLKHMVEIGDFGYLSERSFSKYAEAFCNFAKRHWDWQPELDAIADCADVVSGCRKVIDTYLEHNSANTVIISTPIYPPFINNYPRNYQLCDVPLTLETYRLDFAGLEKAFAECTAGGKRAVYALCNPENPSGTVHTANELRVLAKLSAKYDVLILSDEIHGALVPKNADGSNAFIPYLSLPEADFGVTVTSVSKAFSIAGMKAALVIPSAHSSRKARDLVWNSGNFRKASSEQFGAKAQTICMNECDEWLANLNQGLRENHAYFDELAKLYFPKAKVHQSEGTYFAWVDFSEYVQDGSITSEPAKFFLKNAKVAFNPGASFATLPNCVQGDTYANFVRINLATSKAIICEACERMGRVC